MKQRTCKKCKKVLPEKYEKKYCEACINKKAAIAKKVVGIVGSAALAIITKGTIKKK